MRWILPTLIWALAIAFNIAACQRVETDGPDAQGYKWQKDLAAVEPVIVYRGVDVFLNCSFAEKAQACSVRRSDGCYIYLPADASEWMEPHERRHCAGWVHPDPLRS